MDIIRFLQAAACALLTMWLTACATHVMWGWFVAPWTQLTSPGVGLIWGMLVMSLALKGIPDFDVEDADLTKATIASVATTITVFIFAAAVHYVLMLVNS